MSGRGVPQGFVERQSRTGAVNMNYVRGGQGPPLLLLHGYPQSWYMWRHVLPELARSFEVIAPDLRGFGATDAPKDGYDKKTVAADVHGLLTSIGLDHDLRIIGHDLGTMVAYAYCAAHPDTVTRLVLTEAPIPDESVYSFPALGAAGPALWNFGFFNVTNGLPEKLTAGREELWVNLFTDALMIQKGSLTPEDVEEYSRHLRDEAHRKASFEHFRAIPQDVTDNIEHRKTKLGMPVLVIAARASLGDTMSEQVKQYATSVTAHVLEDSGHWLFEEQPNQLLDLVLPFLRDQT